MNCDLDLCHFHADRISYLLSQTLEKSDKKSSIRFWSPLINSPTSVPLLLINLFHLCYRGQRLGRDLRTKESRWHCWIICPLLYYFIHVSSKVVFKNLHLMIIYRECGINIVRKCSFRSDKPVKSRVSSSSVAQWSFHLQRPLQVKGWTNSSSGWKNAFRLYKLEDF